MNLYVYKNKYIYIYKYIQDYNIPDLPMQRTSIHISKGCEINKCFFLFSSNCSFGAETQFKR